MTNDEFRVLMIGATLTKESLHEGNHFDYVVECEANQHGMTWFATVFRGTEIRGNPNGILDGVEIEHPDLPEVLNDIVGKSIRDRIGVRT